MNRRNFLHSVGVALAVIALIPKRIIMHCPWRYVVTTYNDVGDRCVRMWVEGVEVGR